MAAYKPDYDSRIREVWQLGKPSRANRHDNTPRPGTAQATLILNLYWHGETYGADLFRRCEMNQGNGNVRIWRLYDFGLVNFEESVISEKRKGSGGSRAIFWQLTPRGERMAQLLIDEARQKEKASA